MGKMVGVAEFKAKCLELLRDMERDGEPITITKRGKIVGVVNPPPVVDAEAIKSHPASLFGFMRGSISLAQDFDPSEPACDPNDWDAVRGEWEPRR